MVHKLALSEVPMLDLMTLCVKQPVHTNYRATTGQVLCRKIDVGISIAAAVAKLRGGKRMAYGSV